MATISEFQVRATSTIDNAPPPIIYIKEAASQTFVKGEFVTINASGYLIETTVVPPPAVYGVAAENAHNDANDGTYSVAVFIATPNVLFEANVKASGSDHTLAQTDIGTAMGVSHDTGDGKWYLDADIQTGTTTRVFTHRIARGSALGDLNGRVLWNFLPNWVQFLATS